jgi:precorrin isomerase/dissimilatory sulfite reductase (desulfoviridin) alpha/beta subunit
LIEGRCPTVFEPMEAADGLLCRVKPFARGWNALDFMAIADASSALGSGQLELTSRGNVQVRGLSPASAREFAGTMVAAGLACADPAEERRRNIVLSNAPDNVSKVLAMGLESWVGSDAELAQLPAKFTFAVGDFGGVNVADINVRRSSRRIVVSVEGGSFEIHTDDPLAVVQSLTHAFLELADVLKPAPRRMRSLIATCGEQALYNVAGLSATRKAKAPTAIELDRPVGSLESDCYGVGIPFGALSAPQMNSLALLAQTYSLRPLIRPSTRRTFTLHGVVPGSHAEFSRAAAQAGFSTDAADPLLRVEACVGSSGCSRGRADARSVARELAPLWSRPGVLHVSGCPKGCAHSQAAELLLVAGESKDQWLVQRDCSPAHLDSVESASLDTIRAHLSTIGGLPAAARPDYIRDGALIYRESFAIIRQEADLSAFTADEARVVVRMIHACGMTDLSRDVQFSGNFYTAAREALLAGMPILCDAEMVAHGVTRARLPTSNAVLCTLHDPTVAPLALRLGNTRSAAAIELWGARMRGAVVVIGNAPTALYHLMDLIEAGAEQPAAVIGVPVGFVGAAESKAALAAWGRVPFLTVHGRRGGSAIAAAAVNALAQEKE